MIFGKLEKIKKEKKVRYPNNANIIKNSWIFIKILPTNKSGSFCKKNSENRHGKKFNVLSQYFFLQNQPAEQYKIQAQ